MSAAKNPLDATPGQARSDVQGANDTVIHARQLTKRFGPFTAVDAIDLDVRAGEIFGFLGANGAGKTTAMKMFIGLSRPTFGEARVAGFDVYTQSESIKRNIGYMSQRFSLYNDLTVTENIRFYGGIYGLDNARLKERTEALIAELGLEEHARTRLQELPLGWKQKLAFSVALIHEPRIVFLD
ncbi:MAG TPA: ABC transporter ATP-binding protein, partial [Flavobacteriales bacterium]|nr:ABC transporter ATP-binding protein [Flavobacteriales bacterium]